MTLTELFATYLRAGGYALTAGDFFSEPHRDERSRPAPPRSFAELQAAAAAAGYVADVPVSFLDLLDPEWLTGGPVWPFADEALAAAYCDLAITRGLLAVVE